MITAWAIWSVLTWWKSLFVTWTPVTSSPLLSSVWMFALLSKIKQLSKDENYTLSEIMFACKTWAPDEKKIYALQPVKLCYNGSYTCSQSNVGRPSFILKQGIYALNRLWSTLCGLSLRARITSCYWDLLWTFEEAVLRDRKCWTGWIFPVYSYFFKRLSTFRHLFKQIKNYFLKNLKESDFLG